MSQIFNKNEIDIVIYHGYCSDGFGAAFVIWNYYKQNFSLEKANSIKYIPAVYQKDITTLSDDFMEELKNKNIIMCDFSYKYNQVLQVINVAKSFIILDHHKTAETDLEKVDNMYKVFDMQRSGCGITWDFFYPNEKMPKFLAHIQDRDIWTQDDPNSSTYVQQTKEFVAYFYEQPFDFELWESYLDEKNTQIAIIKGTAWLEYKNLTIKKLLNKTSYILQEIDNQLAVVLYINSADFKSDIGNKVFKKFPIGDFSCIWDYDLYKNETSYSFRSTDDRFDVSKIAGKFGGGGHRNASGKKFEGLVGMLPFDRKDDFGLLPILMNGIKEKQNIDDTEETYILFKVKEINEKWVEENYLNLIKRKYSDCLYIVFETQSLNVNVDNNGNIQLLKTYNIFYNEKALCKPEKQLQFLVYCSKDYVLSIDSTKEFNEIFSDLNKLKMSNQNINSAICCNPSIDSSDDSDGNSDSYD